MRCPGCGYTANHLGATSCKLCGTPMDEQRKELGGRPPRRAPAPVRGQPSGQAPSLRTGPGRKGPPRKGPPRKGPPNAARDWTRYMLVTPGSMPKTLEVGKRFVFGRATDADLSIPSQRVSREHAALTWEGKQAFLEDLGSQNGTQINGRPIVKKAELKDGDEITIGPYLCTYKASSGVGSVAKVDRSAAAADTVADMSDQLAGNLDQMDLWELLDSLEHNEKTGTLEVFHPDGAAGKLVLRGGWPIHATVDEVEGRKAADLLLTWTEGLFRFTGGQPAERPNMKRITINALLHEANERLTS